jgi:hypothetical protein
MFPSACAQATREAIDLNSHVLGAMQETIQGIAIVKAFTMEGELEQKINKIIVGAEGREQDRQTVRAQRAADRNLCRLCGRQRAGLCRLPLDLLQRPPAPSSPS